MAKTYTSVTQRVWQLIGEKPDAIHTILPSQDRATSRARDLRKNSSATSAANRPGCIGITRAEAGHMIAEATLFLQSKGLSRGDRISILGWDTFHFLALSRAAKGLGLLLAPPPYRDPGRLELVSLEARSPREPEPQLLPWSGPKLDVLTRTQKLYTDLAAFGDEEVALTGTGSPEKIRIEMVTTNYFSLLGLAAGAGRVLRPDDGAHVAVIGSRLFHERFGGDRAVLGRLIGLNRVPLTIVGVAPDGFRGLTGDADVFVPLAAAPALTYPTALTEAWNLWLEVVGRVGEGRPSATALASLASGVREGTPLPPLLSAGRTSGVAPPPRRRARKAMMRRPRLESSRSRRNWVATTET